LTLEEREVGVQRLLRDGNIKTDEQSGLKASLKHALNWKFFVRATVGFSYGVVVASVGNFLPQLV
jgi:hypothetical protein